MKIVRFRHSSSVYSGKIEGETIRTISGAGRAKREFLIKDVTLLAPVVPSKIVAVGLNYRDHAKELNMPLPVEPVIFLKPATGVIGPGDIIKYPKSSRRVDYEAELAVVIRERARNVNAKKAHEYIAGYTCFNDVTARDLQEQDTQWTRSKSFDTFAPVGPWIETDLEPDDLAVKSHLNGILKQSSRTSEFIFKIPELVEFISGVMTLLPGDIIATGTPPGVGGMSPGDEIKIEIEGIGILVNRVGTE